MHSLTIIFLGCKAHTDNLQGFCSEVAFNSADTLCLLGVLAALRRDVSEEASASAGQGSVELVPQLQTPPYTRAFFTQKTCGSRDRPVFTRGFWRRQPGDAGLSAARGRVLPRRKFSNVLRSFACSRCLCVARNQQVWGGYGDVRRDWVRKA